MFSSAISVQHLSCAVGEGPKRRLLIEDISFTVPKGHFAAIIGSSGCGKSTLLRAVTGIVAASSEGEITLLGHSLADYKWRFPLGIGYLPQFSEAHENLTVTEILGFSARLQLPSTVSAETRRQWLDYLVRLAGLEEVAHQRYRTLSGGQRRRVALAEALMADPPILLVDELTSGLDPKAEAAMMEWLRFLAHESGKTILLVTHAVHNLALADSVLFMKRGRLVYHGPHEELLRVCAPARLEELYRDENLELPTHGAHFAASDEAGTSAPQPVRSAGPAPRLRQFLTLVQRQFLLLGRDRGQILLHLGLLFTFPALVAVFALGGLPQVRNVSLSLDMTNILSSLQEQLVYLKDSMSSATLISGLIMFQVILLTLSGANNGSREIAKERSILAKERRNGLSATAYVSSKFLQVFLFSLAQAFWMTWFVKVICKFPGSFGIQFGILFLTTLAMGTVCLAISAAANSSEKASLQAIYLVGLQLPLSGAVLALPEWLVWITRPFIAAYWGWSGYLKSLADYRIYDIVRQTTTTWLIPPSTAAIVLAVHIVAAFSLCVICVSRSQPHSGES